MHALPEAQFAAGLLPELDAAGIATRERSGKVYCVDVKLKVTAILKIAS